MRACYWVLDLCSLVRKGPDLSIIASVKVYDGVVMGADSVTSITGSTPAGLQFIKSYRHANKLFQIGGLPIAVGTYGAGNIGGRSIENYIREFSEKESKTTLDSTEALTKRLREFLLAPYQSTFGELPAAQQPVLGVYVGGYSPNNPLGEEWEFVLPQDSAPKAVRPATEFGASWRGISLPFTRLYRGFDPRIQARLRALGVEEQVIEQVKKELPNLPITFDGMPLQDAIDFVHFILSTTVYVSRFEVGVASCGGPLDIAMITPYNFEWITKKKFGAPGETHGD
jgi:hypothetical protein